MTVEQCTRFWTANFSFNNLTSLTIIALFSDPRGVEILCEAFSRSGNGDALRYLSLDIVIFSAHNLRSLAAVFPGLNTLSIKVIRISYDEFVLWPPDMFEKQMREADCRLIEWQLCDLELIHVHARWKKYRMYGTMEVIAAVVPSIKSFCGRGDTCRPGPQSDPDYPDIESGCSCTLPDDSRETAL